MNKSMLTFNLQLFADGNHEHQERYSSLVDLKLRDTLVQKDGVVWNNRYEGTPTAGAVKIPVRDTEVAIGAYDKKNGAAKTHGATSYLTVVIDKDYAVNELIDGYDAAAVPDNLVADRLDSAGYSMAVQMNTDSTTELVAGGTAMGDTAALAKDTVYASFVDARTQLSKNKIPTQNRWALVSPDIYALLLQCEEFVRATAMGDSVVQSGAVGRIAGFTVYEDNTLPTNVDYIVGHPDWCHRIKEWMVPVKLQSLNESGTYIGASAVQGRQVYAHKVSKKQAVLVKKNA